MMRKGLSSDPCLSWRDNCGGARADRQSKGRRGSLLRCRGEIKATVQGFHAFPDREEADLRRELSRRSLSQRVGGSLISPTRARLRCPWPLGSGSTPVVSISEK